MYRFFKNLIKVEKDSFYTKMKKNTSIIPQVFAVLRGSVKNVSMGVLSEGVSEIGRQVGEGTTGDRHGLSAGAMVGNFPKR